MTVWKNGLPVMELSDYQESVLFLLESARRKKTLSELIYAWPGADHPTARSNRRDAVAHLSRVGLISTQTVLNMTLFSLSPAGADKLKEIRKAHKGTSPDGMQWVRSVH